MRRLKDVEETPKIIYICVKISGTIKSKPMPNASSDEQLANEFVVFFIGKTNKIRDDLVNHEKYTPCSQTAVPPFRDIEPLQETEVTKIVKSMAIKSCEMDVLPTTLLKDNLDTLYVCLQSYTIHHLHRESIQNLGKQPL